jgi:hypothetical protein
LSVRIDPIEQASQSLIPFLGDLSEAFPEFVFKTDARATASNNNRVLDDWEFHDEAVRPIATFNPSAKE